MTTDTTQLPPLPEPYAEQCIDYAGVAVNRTDIFGLFTAGQMRAYALAALSSSKGAANV